MVLARRTFFNSLKFRGQLNVLASASGYRTFSAPNQPVFPKHKLLLQVPPAQVIRFRHFADFPPHVVVKLPSLSPTMETGSVVSWAKEIGDQVNEGDLIAEIETDKATMSMDASDEGYLAQILHPQGAKNIPVGDPLLILVESLDMVPKFTDFKREDALAGSAAPAAAAPVAPSPATAAPVAPSTATVAPVATSPTAAPAPQVKPVVVSTPSSGRRVFISPLARQVALERGIDINSLSGSGSGIDGCFVLADLDHIASAPSAHRGAGAYTDVPVSGMRATIAKRLLESKQTIPHFYLTVDIELDELLKTRKSMNDSLAKQAKGKETAKISVTDLLIKAMALANKAIPDCNSSWMGNTIRQYNAVDVSVAVATPNGLITPIVFNAESKGILTISQEVRALAQKAKNSKLQPAEFQGGTITISNLGMYGISSFSAIINPPQACILAVGGAQKKLLLDEDGNERQATVMSVTLCCDHRVVDGAVGAQWISEFKTMLECPSRMLM